MKRLLLLITVIIVFGLENLQAQEGECLEPRFLPGQPVKVIGSVDAGGMPYRARTNLESEVLGFIPLGIVLQTHGEWGESQLCTEGRNWYEILYDNMRVWIVDGDGHSYWLQPQGLCSVEHSRLNAVDSVGMLENLNYFSSENSLHLATMNDEYHLLNFETGLLSTTASHSHIVMPEFVRIMDALLPYPMKPVSVSPDQSKVLYLVPSLYVIPECAHGCHTYYLYVADSDGSNMTFLLHTAVENHIDTVYWGNNGYFYITFISETGGWYWLLEVCDDGSCQRQLDIQIEELNEIHDSYSFGFPSISPNGQYIVVKQLFSNSVSPGAVILNRENNSIIQLPDNGELTLPILWESDRVIYYPVDYDPFRADQIWEFETDAIVKIELDYDLQTFEVKDVVLVGDLFLHTRNIYWLHHNNRFIIYNNYFIDIYCIPQG